MKLHLSLTMLGGLALAAVCPAADLTYTENTQLTGGSMKSMLGLAARFGGTNLSKGTLQTVTVSGNKMAHRSGDSSTIFDLDASTMTTVDYKDKKYSTMTFQEMADAIANMPQAMADARAKSDAKDAKADVKVKVSAVDKGAGPSIAGVPTKLTEVVVDTTTTVTDAKSGQTATINTSMKTEQAMGKPQAWETVRDFYKRMATKMPFQPDASNQMMRQAGLTVEAMTEAGKKLGSLDGMAMRSVTQMIGPGSAAPQVEMPTAKDLAKGALGNLAGGLGGFGRKKKEEPAPAAAPAAPAGPNVLLEFTTEVTSIQPGVADAQAFVIPAGFKMEESPMKRFARDGK